MATIYNSDLSKELQQGAKLQIRDKMPTELAEKVVPVMEVNPKLLRRIDFATTASKLTTGANTAYTTPTDRDFFLTNFTFHLIKDAACDAASGEFFISVVQNGATKKILSLGLITLTAQDELVTVQLAAPMKLDRNSIITHTVSYTAGYMARHFSFQGYIIENVNA